MYTLYIYIYIIYKEYRERVPGYNDANARYPQLGENGLHSEALRGQVRRFYRHPIPTRRHLREEVSTSLSTDLNRVQHSRRREEKTLLWILRKTISNLVHAHAIFYRRR